VGPLAERTAIGAFGNYEFMKKVNGDANIIVAAVGVCSCTR
jgi:hypothetical protein